MRQYECPEIILMSICCADCIAVSGFAFEEQGNDAENTVEGSMLGM